ncbi:hypothetical protein [Neobacillus sp.]|uniref:hypothetical protein n=1 Tax=Neobacillus sp. TaxID=2675273 RepID=UPI002898767B|nr:hypothetical protein [Neobacillus sp.]
MIKIRNTSKFLGVVGGVSSIILWIVFNFYNPYSNLKETEPMITTFLMLVLPACLAIIASIKPKKLLMLIAFLWSLPISLYLIGTPGIFALFGVTNIIYLISFLFMILAKKRDALEQ